MAGQEDLFGVPDALEALAQLEQNTSEVMVQSRASERLDIRTKVLIHPGNASQRGDFVIEGLTGDISNGGCLALAGRPAMAGDVFFLRFAEDRVSIGPLLARCMRCRMVREDTFEIGFRFFEQIDLASAIERQP